MAGGYPYGSAGFPVHEMFLKNTNTNELENNKKDDILTFVIVCVLTKT